MAVDIEGLYINGIYFGMFSSIKSKNELSYSSEPSRDNSMALNSEEMEHAYIPTCECTMGLMTASDYQRLIQSINTPNFTVKYFDSELNQNVTHTMYCTDYDLGTLYHKGTNLNGLLGTKISFVGYYGYSDYDSLATDNYIGKE